jgi:prepilin signal peptidase PulO-like enzyme (type II secretory pathway)
MEAVLPLAGFGFALGWPLEWVIQRFPQGVGTAPSSRRRWIVAAITAALFALEAISIGFVPELLPALLLTALVVPAAAIDLEHRIIPDLINLPGALAVYVVGVALQPDRWLELLLGGLGCFAFFLVAHMIYPKGMGMGDVKMSLMIGLGLGSDAFLALFAAFLASTVLSMFLIVTRGRKGLKVGVPFGPFLAFGAIVALIWGAQLSPVLTGG